MEYLVKLVWVVIIPEKKKKELSPVHYREIEYQSHQMTSPKNLDQVVYVGSVFSFIIQNFKASVDSMIPNLKRKVKPKEFLTRKHWDSQ